MIGTEAFLELLRRSGVRYLFGNPGHTELPMLDLLAGMEDMTYVLGLNEGVALAMADGYAMASDELGVFCSHITPGFGNAMGMLYDAGKTGAPLLVMAGQQDGRFSFTEPALWGDMVAMARPLTKWAHQVERVGDLTRAVRRAIKVATTQPTGPVFLSLPSDVLRGEGEFDLTPPSRVAPRACGDREEVRRAALALCRAEEPVLIAGDGVGRSGSEDELRDLAEFLGAGVFSETSSNTLNFDASHPLYQGTLSRVQTEVRSALERSDVLLSVGADVFTMAAYAETDPMPPGARLLQLGVDPWQLGKNYPAEALILGDPKATLPVLLAEARSGAGEGFAARAAGRRAAWESRRAETLASARALAEAGAGRSPLAPTFLMRRILQLAPDDAVLLDESNTTGLLLRPLMFERKLEYFGLKGGGLGWGLPASIGLAFARPSRPVLALLGDGGALYTVPALWTAAHHRARVVFVICNNAQYRIVKHRLHSYGGVAARKRRYLGVELRDPVVDFAGLGRAMGLWAARIDHPDQLEQAFREALSCEGPALLDVAVEGSHPEREAPGAPAAALSAGSRCGT